MICKTQIKKFIESFGQVGIASEILNTCFFDFENGIIVKDEYEDYLKDVEEAFNLRCYQLSVGMLSAEFTEVENNLFALTTENRIIYIKDLIRSFKDVAFYFDNPIYVEHPILNKRTENIYNFMQDYCSYEDSYPNLSIPQEYVCECYWALNLFASYLDAKLLKFNLDLQELQRSEGIFIWRERDFDSLKEAGFNVSDLENNDWLINAFKRGLRGNVPETDNVKGDLLLPALLIFDLKNKFDGLIWEKEDIQPEDFLSYWRVGTKPKPLPLLEDVGQTRLVYLFEHVLKRHLPRNITQDQLGKFFGIQSYRVVKSRNKDRWRRQSNREDFIRIAFSGLTTH